MSFNVHTIIISLCLIAVQFHFKLSFSHTHVYTIKPKVSVSPSISPLNCVLILSQVTETRTGPLGCSSYDNLDSVSSVLLQSPESKLHLQGKHTKNFPPGFYIHQGGCVCVVNIGVNLHFNLPKHSGHQENVY